MKTKYIVIIICCILITAFLLGATGAVKLEGEAPREDAGPDSLIGVLITREYLDLFDAEGYFNDNIGSLTDGQVITASDSAAYRGRIYAELVDTVHRNEETGESITSKEYVFKVVDGIRLIAPYISDGSASYQASTTDEGVSDAEFHFQSKDESQSMSLKGTIYVTSQGDIGSFYFNPVYQTAGGEVYAVSGEGVTFGSDEVPGSSWSTRIEDKREVTSEGASTSSGAQVEVTVSVVSEPTGIALLQFNGENELSSRTEYRPGALPEHIDVLPGTQYIIIETASPDGVDRALFQRGDGYLSAFYCREDGICVKQSGEIGWG